MCSHIPAKLGDEGVLALVRAISAMDNKRYRDAGGAKSASLSKKVNKYIYMRCGYGCFLQITQHWASDGQTSLPRSITHTPCGRGGGVGGSVYSTDEDNWVPRVQAQYIMLLGAGFLSAVCGCYFVELDLFGLRTHTAYLIPFHFGKIPKSPSRV